MAPPTRRKLTPLGPRIAKAFYDGATKAIKNANIALVQNDGIFAPKGGQKTNALEWLGDGDWVNIKEVPLAIDSKDDTVKTGGDLMYSFVGASIINYAWRKQGVYLACYTMSKDECECPVVFVLAPRLRWPGGIPLLTYRNPPSQGPEDGHERRAETVLQWPRMLLPVVRCPPRFPNQLAL